MSPIRPPTSYVVRDVTVSPNVVLAPMEGVTDVCFRRVVRGIGGVGLTCTEFVASKGLAAGKSKRLWEMASFDPDERPVAVQLYGRDPEAMAEAGRLVQDRGASIVDINMGCPSKKVVKNSGGSALMAEPEHAVSIVRAVRAAVSVPVTVKMRSGFDDARRNAADLAFEVQEEGADAVAIHWRTREDRYGGVRRVDQIAEAVQRLSIPVVANGDIVDVPSAARMFAETGCAGVMIGRGAIKNPWLLRQISQWVRGEPVVEPKVAQRLDAVIAFIDAMTDHFRNMKGVLARTKMITRHFTEGMADAEEVRTSVLRAATHLEARELLAQWRAELTRPDREASRTVWGSSSSAPGSG